MPKLSMEMINSKLIKTGERQFIVTYCIWLNAVLILSKT